MAQNVSFGGRQMAKIAAESKSSRTKNVQVFNSIFYNNSRKFEIFVKNENNYAKSQTDRIFKNVDGDELSINFKVIIFIFSSGPQQSQSRKILG